MKKPVLNPTDRSNQRITVGDTLRSNQGKGPYVAKVVEIDDVKIHLQLIKAPTVADAPEPIRSWSIARSLLMVTGWRLTAPCTERPMLDKAALKAMQAKVRGPAIYISRPSEVSAAQVMPGETLPPGVTLVEGDEQLVLFGTLPRGAMGFISTPYGRVPTCWTDWIVYDTFGMRVFTSDAFALCFCRPDAIDNTRDFVYHLNAMSASIYRWSQQHGLWDNNPTDVAKIEHICRLLTELLKQSNEPIVTDLRVPGRNSVEIAAANVIIAVLDYTAAKHLRIGEAVAETMRYNKAQIPTQV